MSQLLNQQLPSTVPPEIPKSPRKNKISLIQAVIIIVLVIGGILAAVVLIPIVTQTSNDSDIPAGKVLDIKSVELEKLKAATDCKSLLALLEQHGFQDLFLVTDPDLQDLLDRMCSSDELFTYQFYLPNKDPKKPAPKVFVNKVVKIDGFLDSLKEYAEVTEVEVDGKKAYFIKIKADNPNMTWRETFFKGYFLNMLNIMERNVSVYQMQKNDLRFHFFVKMMSVEEIEDIADKYDVPINGVKSILMGEWRLIFPLK